MEKPNLRSPAWFDLFVGDHILTFHARNHSTVYYNCSPRESPKSAVSPPVLMMFNPCHGAFAVLLLCAIDPRPRSPLARIRVLVSASWQKKVGCCHNPTQKSSMSKHPCAICFSNPEGHRFFFFGTWQARRFDFPASAYMLQ